MSTHISRSCSATFFWLQNIKRISQFLPRDKLEMVLHAFVTSRIDYCNGLLYGLPDCEIAKLQTAQNPAARLLMSCKKYDHITPILINLHWLPVRYRINFKILLLTFKALLAWHLVTCLSNWTVRAITGALKWLFFHS